MWPWCTVRTGGGARGVGKGGGAVEEQLTPVSACREEEGCEEEGRRKGGWGRSKGRGLFECRWKHQAPEKDFQDAFISL